MFRPHTSAFFAPYTYNSASAQTGYRAGHSSLHVGPSRKLQIWFHVSSLGETMSHQEICFEEGSPTMWRERLVKNKITLN